MNDHPSNDNYPKTFSFSPFDSGADKGVVDISVWKRTVARSFAKSLRRTMPSPRTARREVAARPVIKSRVVCRYEVDVYGRPRILSRWEVILHAMAWPVMIGVVIGYGLAITPLVIQHASMSKPQVKASRSLVESQEAAP